MIEDIWKAPPLLSHIVPPILLQPKKDLQFPGLPWSAHISCHRIWKRLIFNSQSMKLNRKMGLQIQVCVLRKLMKQECQGYWIIDSSPTSSTPNSSFSMSFQVQSIHFLRFSSWLSLAVTVFSPQSYQVPILSLS